MVEMKMMELNRVSFSLLQGCYILRLVCSKLWVRFNHQCSISFDLLYSVSADLLRMFFDALYDEDVIKEEAFYKWESSKDPAEQTGKGVALKSVTAFFTWLREAEEESDKE